MLLCYPFQKTGEILMLTAILNALYTISRFVHGGICFVFAATFTILLVGGTPDLFRELTFLRALVATVATLMMGVCTIAYFAAAAYFFFWKNSLSNLCRAFE